KVEHGAKLITSLHSHQRHGRHLCSRARGLGYRFSDAGYEDAEDNNGVFSGLMEYTGGVKEWLYNGFIGQYKNDLWQYKRQGGATGIGAEGTGAGYTAKSGEVPGHTDQPGSEAAKPAPMCCFSI
ncbi:MAG TPA: hypothetical protein VGK77_05550, partial [Candidatus Binatia bacterium]